MTNRFHISGFKCFSNSHFELKNLTVLSGSNGTGKSSLIQALLLLRLSIERNALDLATNHFIGKSWRGYPTALNSGYELTLGTVYDIFRQDGIEDNKIVFGIDEERFEIPIPDDKSDDSSVKILLKTSIDFSKIPFWRKKEFYYLNTERLGPRHGLNSNFTDFINCGYKGEYTAQVILENPFFKIKDSRAFLNSKSENLPQQIDLWLDYICPGTTIRVDPLGTMSSQVKVRNNFVKNHVLATNVGFGISYSLPVIVTGLIAEKDSVFIVENPEAHLHPKGQSNMGFFLGKVAAAGVKVIVETHSEHIVNGIRKATLSNSHILNQLPSDEMLSNLTSDDLIIYFFNGIKNGKEDVIKINMDPKGNLNPFPRDFFDQVQQDMADIYRLTK